MLFLAIKQQKILVGLPEGGTHPSVDLLLSYVEEGIPGHNRPPV